MNDLEQEISDIVKKNEVTNNELLENNFEYVCSFGYSGHIYSNQMTNKLYLFDTLNKEKGDEKYLKLYIEIEREKNYRQL